MKSSQRLTKLPDWMGVWQYGTHFGECLGDADAALPRAVKRSDTGGAALSLDTVDQHNPALPAQLLDKARGIEQDEVEVVVDARLIDEADINLFGLGGQVGLTDPAQRHHRIHTFGQ